MKESRAIEDGMREIDPEEALKLMPGYEIAKLVESISKMSKKEYEKIFSIPTVRLKKIRITERRLNYSIF